MDTLARFKNGEFQLLVCSDVAARGLDLPEVSHVFNFDVPIHAEDYVHRIGRTGRAGRAGRSIMLALPEEARALAAVTGLLGHPIAEMAVDSIDGWSGGDPAPRDGRRRRARKRPADKPRGKPTARNAAPARNVAPESRNGADRRPAKAAPRRAEPHRAEPHGAEPAKAAPEEQAPKERALREQAVKERAPKERAPRERAPQERAPQERAPKERAVKERAVAAPSRASEPFGEHTPAFMLRPVDIV
jgi:superfamily II DNA/RNA helicase